MAEERIYIGVGKDGEEPIYFNHFTREEAIERMAKGLAEYNDPVKSGQTAEEIWNKTLAEETKSFYLRQAEVALDALIKGE